MTRLPIYDAAVRAWCADQVADTFADLRVYVGLDNPLAVGEFWCPVCGTRLDKADRPCPMECVA